MKRKQIAKKTSTEVSTPTFFEYENFLKQNAASILLKNHIYYIKKYKVISHLFNALPCAVYMLDYQTKQYIFVSKNCEKIIGYSANEIMQKGNAFYADKLHPEDLEIYSSKVFKEFIVYTSTLAQDEIKKARLSFNYRFKRKDGVYIHILQQFEVLEVNKQNNPVLVLGFVTDITAHKKDDKVVYAISTYDKKNGFSMVTTDSFPQTHLVVSAREKEIIKGLVEGLGSKQIAGKLHISLYTVNAHRRNILKKVQVKNTSELISYAIANAMV
jgi:PAS domain S-box-containing protein